MQTLFRFVRAHGRSLIPAVAVLAVAVLAGCGVTGPLRSRAASTAATSMPDSPADAVHIVVIQHTGTGPANAHATVIYDKTLTDASLAQRLQHDLTLQPAFPPTPSQGTPVHPDSCGPMGLTYTAYTLTWLRNGVPVETATSNQDGCNFWHQDGTIVRRPGVPQAIITDMHTLAGVPLPIWNSWQIGK